MTDLASAWKTKRPSYQEQIEAVEIALDVVSPLIRTWGGDQKIISRIEAALGTLRGVAGASSWTSPEDM